MRAISRTWDFSNAASRGNPSPAEMHEIHGLWVHKRPCGRSKRALVRVELRRAGRRDDEGAMPGIQFAIRNTEGVAGENTRVRRIDTA